MGNQSGKIIVNHRGSKFIDTDVDAKNSRTNWIAGNYIDCDAVIMQCSTTVKVKMMSKRIFAQSSFTATFRRIYVSAFFTHDRLLELKKPFCN